MPMEFGCSTYFPRCAFSLPIASLALHSWFCACMQGGSSSALPCKTKCRLLRGRHLPRNNLHLPSLPPPITPPTSKPTPQALSSIPPAPSSLPPLQTPAATPPYYPLPSPLPYPLVAPATPPEPSLRHLPNPAGGPPPRGPPSPSTRPHPRGGTGPRKAPGPYCSDQGASPWPAPHGPSLRLRKGPTCWL